MFVPNLSEIVIPTIDLPIWYDQKNCNPKSATHIVVKQIWGNIMTSLSNSVIYYFAIDGVNKPGYTTQTGNTNSLPPNHGRMTAR